MNGGKGILNKLMAIKCIIISMIFTASLCVVQTIEQIVQNFPINLRRRASLRERGGEH